MPRASDVSPSSSSLIAFKPRQVLLLEQQQLAVSAQMAKAILENPAQLKPEDESLLLFSVALWLENKGFSKVLKRFLSAAQIQDDTWKAKALNLNEVFSKYQEIRNRALEQVTSQKKQEEQADITEETNGDANCTASEQIESKNKKKKGKGDTRVAEAGKKSNITTIDEKMNEPDVHDKGDLSYKIPHDLSHKDHKFKAAKESNGEEVTVDQSTKKQKDKKKKSSSISQSLDADEKQIDIIPGATESDQGLLSKKSNAEVLDTEITIHKKSKKKSVEAGKKFTTIDEKMNEPDVHDKGDESYKIPDDLSHKDHKFKASKESNGEEVTVDQSTKKQKDKKKKSSSISQSLDADEKQIDIIPEATESENQGLLSKKSAAEVLDTEMTIHTKSKKKSVEAAENVVNESKKASKKRKRMAPDENENHSGEGVVVEESKSKKSKGLEEGKDVPQVAHPGANGHAGKQNKEENLIRSQVGSQDLSTEQTDGSTKIIINENRVDTSGQQKSARKQRNHSAEPKTVNAFQRVKVDEVEFVDERLQDNSYWAKDGAETGYGAKAQEVLGQVRGRDFRHEKTKKKRGSYRGGQIDLQSHSIKFNYPDE